MSENKAIDKANLELALSENNKKLLEYTDNADTKLRQEFGPVSKYQRYLNTELDYVQVSFLGDTTVNNVAVGTIIPFNKVVVSNNIEFDASTYVFKLKAGKTYKITSRIRTLSSSGWLYFSVYNKTKGKVMDPWGCVEVPSTYNNNVANVPTETVIDCDEDTEIQIKVVSMDKTRTIIFTGLCSTFIEEINRQTVIDPVEHVNTEYGLEDTPVGHIISRMGAITPKHYLLCDGSEHNIADYPHLAQHIIDSFGSVNYYGGDGINTFKVPNLMYNIGDATEFAPNMKSESTPSPYKVTASSYLNDFYPYKAFDGNTSNFWHNHYSTTTEDWLMFDAGEKMKIVGFKIFARPGFSSQAPCRFKIQGSDDGESFEDIEVYNVTWAGSNGSQSFDCPLSNYRFYRFYFSYKSSDYGGNELSFSEVRFFLPKEIKVATFIKYEPTYYTKVDNTNYLSASLYSLEERVIGSWIDGKPLYEKTFKFESIRGLTNVKITIDNPDTIFVAEGYGINQNADNIPLLFPYPDKLTEVCTAFVRSTKNEIGFRLGSNVTLLEAFVTIRYTKTTDEENSFTDDMIKDYIASSENHDPSYTDDEINTAITDSINLLNEV